MYRKPFWEATNMDHPFKVGGRYRNRTGDYVVTAINGESMTARYDDGHEQTLNVAKQTHIWQSIMDEELVTVRHSDFSRHDFDADERLITWPVRQLIEDVLQARFSPPYPRTLLTRSAKRSRLIPAG